MEAICNGNGNDNGNEKDVDNINGSENDDGHVDDKFDNKHTKLKYGHDSSIRCSLVQGARQRFFL